MRHFCLLINLCFLFALGTSASNLLRSDEAVDSAAYRATAKDAMPTIYDGYLLVWHDEFDEDGLPRAKRKQRLINRQKCHISLFI